MKKENLYAIIIIIVVAYFLLSFISWNLNPAAWSGFTRFLLAFFILLTIAKNLQ